MKKFSSARLTNVSLRILMVSAFLFSLITAFINTEPVSAETATSALAITGVIDGPLTGGIPKAIELYAFEDIADLSAYGVGSANNGEGTDGEEFTFPADSVSAGDFIYIATESTAFESFFGFAPDYVSSTAAAINGDDAVELFFNSTVADVFGDINTDGTGQAWDYLDGWAYRLDVTGPDGSTFELTNWKFSGTNALDGETTNAAATTPFPAGTYVDTPPTLILTGAFDGPLTGGIPKGVEIYVNGDIADLSVYGVGFANNGEGTDGQEFTFPAVSASNGDFLYVASESTAFESFFGFAPDYVDGDAAINGDDAIELFKDGMVIDTFGQLDVDGTGQAWEYLDGWAYRNDNTGPDGTTFTIDNWSFSGINQLEGGTTNATVNSPFPAGTYLVGGGGDEIPEVSSTTPTNGATEVSLSSDIVINFSEDMTVSSDWFDITCDSSGEHTAAVTGGPQSYTLNPDSDFSFSESCTVTIYASGVTDQDEPVDNMDEDYSFSFTAEAPSECGNPATLISAVQGDGAASPLVDTSVTIEGIVVGDFQANGELYGFFLQEEDEDADADAATSEGVFVYHTSDDVSVGDKVRLTGTVAEYYDLTEIKTITDLEICSNSNAAPTAGSLSLPLTSSTDPEAVEGMLVQFSQTLYVTETYNLGRYGQVSLSSGAPLDNPTNVAEPGEASNAVAAANDLNVITLDDGSNIENPNTIEHLNPSGETLRIGDSVENLYGVMYYSYELYRVTPLADVTFVESNPRPTAPGGDDELTVASFNVLNYFTTLDDGVNDICGPAGNLECRGADSETEFTRQRDKILNALVALDADIVGLIEIENNISDAAVIDLVGGLNDALGAGTYDYISTGTIGTDAIKVALIYKPATVTPSGDYAILDSSVDADFADNNRPALAQTFTDDASDQDFTVIINHLKSKGSSCGEGDDSDIQGNCNLTRTNAAGALVDWLATDPTSSDSDKFLIIGDLNSYAKEDPIDVLVAGGYTDLVAEFGEGAALYSYIYDGERGYLDHGLASDGLLNYVTDTKVWHINSDEPRSLDYNTEYNQDANGLYDSSPYRSSDHDPVVISLSLEGQTTAIWSAEFGYNDGWGADQPRVLGDVNGDGFNDVIGFSSTGVMVAPGDGSTFGTAAQWSGAYGSELTSGGWTADNSIRTTADVNGDGYTDIVGFGSFGVVVSLSTGTEFSAPAYWSYNYGSDATAGGWSSVDHNRVVADVNGDGKADIVGFADYGVLVSLSNGSGFDAPTYWIMGYGKLLGDWDGIQNPRMIADVNGDGCGDVVGFSNWGVLVSLSNACDGSTPTNTFGTPTYWTFGYAYLLGDWDSTLHIRTFGDVDNDGDADLIGFGSYGVLVSLSDGSGSFGPANYWIMGYGSDATAGGWDVADHPRVVSEVTGDGKVDVVGFFSNGVLVSPSYGTMFK